MRGWFFAVLAAYVMLPACGSDKSPFAKGTGRGGSSAAEGGRLGSGGFTELPAGRGGKTGSGGRVSQEPPGENVLSVLHGVVDAPRIAVCFAKGQTLDAPALGEPRPSGGLAYGASLVLHEIAGIDWTKDVLSTWVIAGDLSLIEGLDCQQAIALAKREMESATDASEPNEAGGAGGAAGASGGGAGGEGGTFSAEPPRLRAARLPFVPAGTLAVGRSSLLVADGCIGGFAYQSRRGESACGAGYSKTNSTLSAALVQLSRRSTPFRLGLQVVHASEATAAVGVSSAPPDGSTSFVVIAGSVERGSVAPPTPELSYDTDTYGVNRDFRVEVSQNGTSLFAEPWSDILSRAGLTALKDGSSYALVLLGPRFGASLTRNQLWNPSRIVLVTADPDAPAP